MEPAVRPHRPVQRLRFRHQASTITIPSPRHLRRGVNTHTTKQRRNTMSPPATETVLDRPAPGTTETEIEPSHRRMPTQQTSGPITRTCLDQPPGRTVRD